MKGVRIVVEKGGKITIEGEGYQGSGCEDAVKFYRERLAVRTTGEEHKPEFYMPESETTSDTGLSAA